MLTESFPAPNLIGQFRQFGELGAAYQIKAPLRLLEDNGRLLLIEVAEAGEEIDYRYSLVSDDPEAH